MKLTVMVAAATLMMFGAAAAQPGGGQGNPAMAKVRDACAADVAKLCPDKTGQERHQCMMANRDKVSDGCKAAAAEMRSMMQAQKPQ
jgi:hypothetical protein